MGLVEHRSCLKENFVIEINGSSRSIGQRKKGLGVGVAGPSRSGLCFFDGAGFGELIALFNGK